MRRVAVLALLSLGTVAALAGCGREVSVVLDPLDAASCAAFCVTTLRVTIDGEVLERPCGAPFEVGAVPTDRPTRVQVQTLGTGFELRGEAEIDPARTQVELQLEPTARPTIERIRVEGRAALLGSATLTVEGRDFGDEAGILTVGDERVSRVASWTSTQLVAETSRPGAVVVERCGVRSFPVDAGLRTPALEQLAPAPACPAGRMVGATALETDAVGEPLGLFDCGSPDCGVGLLVRLPLEAARPSQVWGPLGMCPTAVSQVEDRRLYLANALGLSRARLSPSDMSIENMPLSMSPARLRRVGGVSLARAYLPISAGALEGPRELWLLEGTSFSRLAAAEIPELIDVDGRYALGRREQVVSVHVLDGATITRSVPVPDCPQPRRIAALHPRALNSVVVVSCAGEANSVLVGLDLASPRPEPRARVALAGLSPTRLALSTDGSLALAWDTGGTLLAVDVIVGETRRRWSLDPAYPSADLVRAPRADVFFLGGPTVGAVTRLDLR